MKLTKIAFLFFFVITSAYTYAQQANDSLSYFINLVERPKRPIDLSNAYSFIDNAKNSAIKNKDTVSTIYCLYNLASITYKVGFYNESENTAIEGLKLLDKVKPTAYNLNLRKSLNNHLGLLYTESDNAVVASSLYNKALKFAQSNKDSIVLYNNISNIYKDKQDYDRAKTYLQDAYALFSTKTDTLTKALVLDNLGYVSFKLNDDNAFQLLQESLKLRVAKQDYKSIYASYRSLSEYYRDQSNIKKATAFSLKALTIANRLNSMSYQMDALGFLVELGDNEYAKDYKKTYDSLLKFEKESLNKFALLKYDHSEYRRKALESQILEEQQEQRTIIAIIVAAFIALLSVFIYFILNSKHKKEKLQQVYDTESRISKQIHDDVANDVFQFMTKLESEDLANIQLIDDLQGIYDKTRDISKEYNVIEGEGLFVDTIRDLVLSYSDATTSVLDKGSADINWETFSKIKRTTIYKVLQELLINMKKHSQASVAVLMFKTEGKKTVITYSDNGVGSDFKKHTGLQNVENRIVSINGTVTFDTQPNKGFKIKIII
ncbi:tetratricopeptide repeat-containing sensor histidine kinase [Winogradskyella ludwigii]|uniref:tetratricopeptide repeat-containing sensor histidine kinase n=1 Tax=Winogradskyella ludwigii TaxID=2686076 RepID=UPI0015CDD2D3|nr:tetratricopeptide repeat-containing sensor histidine kinase [Winogradskyella ludwigii]